MFRAPVRFLLDSGSAVSLICKSVIRTGCGFESTKVKVRSLSNQNLQIYGSIACPLESRQQHIDSPTLLATDFGDFPFDGILGTDLLEKWNASLDFKSKSLILPNLSIPFLSMLYSGSFGVALTTDSKAEDVVDSNVCCRIFVAENRTIPPRCHGFLRIKFPQWVIRNDRLCREKMSLGGPSMDLKEDGQADEITGIQTEGCKMDGLNWNEWLIPAHHLENGLVLGSTIVKLSATGQSTISFLNVGDAPVTIRNGDFLGFAELFDESGVVPITFDALDSMHPVHKCDDIVAAVVDKDLTDTEKPCVEGIVAPSVAANFETLCEEVLDKSDAPLSLRPLIKNVLLKFEDVLAKPGDKVGSFDLWQPTIPLTTDEPVHKPPFKIPHHMRPELDKITDKYLEDGVIQHSTSPYNSPAFLVPKKDGGFRLVVDYRHLNKFVISDVHPLPQIQQILEDLGGSLWFTALDIFIGFHNIKVAEKDRPKTAFSTHSGHFQFISLPMGLKNSPAIFQRVMNLILSGFLNKFCFIYVDDVIIFSKSESEHLDHLEKILQRLKDAGFKVKLSKCQLFKKSLNYLGYQVSTRGLAVDPAKVAAVQNFPRPACIRDLQAFLGLVNYFRVFIDQFAKTARPLYSLLKKTSEFSWNSQAEMAFQTLKTALITAPVLRFPDFSRPFVVTTDASAYALGCVVTQEFEDGEFPIAYASRILKNHELNYNNTDRELLAVVFGVKTHRSYLWGSKFIIRTDNAAVKCLAQNTQDNPRAVRFYMELADYDFLVEHRKGKHIPHVDALSRYPPAVPFEYRDADDDAELVAYLSPHLRSECFVPVWDSADLVRETAAAQPPTETIKIGALHYHERVLSDGFPARVLWVPPPLRSSFIAAFHDPPSAGHVGRDKLLAAMEPHVYWEGMRSDVENFLRSCDVCQRFKARAHKVPQQPFTIPLSPFETVSLDVVGPIPISRSGFQYILVIQDQLSRWLQFNPMRDQSADTVARVFLSRWVHTFGVPRRILTDRGSNFVSTLFRRLLHFLGSKAVNTTAYHPQANGANERSHRHLHSYLAMYLNPAQRYTWDTLLSDAAWVHNSSLHSSLQMSPYEVLFGFKPTIARAWLPDANFVEADDFSHKYFGISRDHLMSIRRKAQEAINSAQIATLERVNRDVPTPNWRIGDLVLIRKYGATTYVGRHWAPKNTGPYRILDIPSPTTVVARHVYTGHEDTFNMKRLSPYRGRSPLPSPVPPPCDTLDDLGSSPPTDLPKKPEPPPAPAPDVDPEILVEVSLPTTEDQVLVADVPVDNGPITRPISGPQRLLNRIVEPVRRSMRDRRPNQLLRDFVR